MSLIVEDDFINDAASYIQEQTTAIYDFIENYIYYMRDLLAKNDEGGFIQGKTAEALELFLDEVRTYSDVNGSSIECLSDKCKLQCSSYIEEVDSADKDLY